MQNKKKILKKKFAHFIFDIDGVILNSKNNMKFSWIATNDKFDLKKSFSKYYGVITKGGGLTCPKTVHMVYG